MESGSRIIGITIMTPTANSAISLIRSIKEAKKDAFIYVGGPHATLMPLDLLEKVPEIDVVVVGEGELTAPELIDAVVNNKNMAHVKGIAFRDNGKPKLTEQREMIGSLDELPLPAYHLMPIEKYRPYPPHGIKLPYIALMTSRGCPYRCIYCSKPIHGRKYRARSPDSVVKEIKYLKEKFGIKEVLFYDDTFTLDRNRTMELCNKMIEEKLNVLWSCETRVNLVDEELLNKMREAGCYIISYGVESGNQDLLEILKKDITLDQVRAAFKLTKHCKILTVGYFMLGVPGETVETMKNTINFAIEIDADFVQFSICTPFPGTELFEYAKKEGINLENWDKFIYVSTSSEKPVLISKNLSAEELKTWYKTAYKRFYLRPKYLLKRAVKLNEMQININGLKMLKDIAG